MIQLIRQPGLQIGMPRPYGDVHAQLTVLVMTAMTGTPETWLLETHDSFASIEALDLAMTPAVQNQLEAMDGQSRFQLEVTAAPKTLIGVYRPTFSYLPADAVKLLPRAHYYFASIYQVRLGTEPEFLEAVRRRRAAYNVVHLDKPELAYQVVSGAPVGTFVFFTPLPSLKTIDEALSRSPETPVKGVSEGEISREHFLLRVEPRQSYVSDEFAETDMEFWRGIAKKE